MSIDYEIVFITAPNMETAQQLAQGLLQKKLAACVNIADGIESLYWWEGKITKAQETLLLAKTKSSLLADILQFVKKNHPYSVPEVISVKMENADKKYLHWLGSACSFSARPKDIEEDV
ncbi:MAG: divalent-cation tolerance protein CutA [Elusimicrobia bacterium]|nr:divalent-cation tolerance protein CutA [Elusimicrobiota bacterium]